MAANNGSCIKIYMLVHLLTFVKTASGNFIFNSDDDNDEDD